MKFRHAFLLALAAAVAALAAAVAPADDKEPLFPERLNVNPPPISSDKTVRYDYDIVYVRVPRKGDDAPGQWAEIAHPALMDPGGDLMLLHPDGSEDLLVRGGDDGSVTDPAVSFDGQWVYYSHIHGLKGTSQNGQPPFGGADLYKIHVKTRKIVRLTEQVFTPNTGAADWSKDCRATDEKKTWLNYGVLNMGPCPLPGGRLAFVSNRNAFRPPKHPSPTLQLFVMDDDGGNVECIGHLNLGMALHPTVLTDGRILFSSLESQGLRNSILWGLWCINPDGTHWQPVISAFDPGDAPNAFHFQTQLSDGHIVAEEYYNQNNDGLGAYSEAAAPAPHPSPLGRGVGVRGATATRSSAPPTTTTRAIRRCVSATSTTPRASTTACRSARPGSNRSPASPTTAKGRPTRRCSTSRTRRPSASSPTRPAPRTATC